MSDGPRRSGRANKGTAPARYTPYSTNRNDPANASASTSSTDTSPDDLDNTVVPTAHQQQQSSNRQQPIRGSMYMVEQQQYVSNMQPRNGSPSPVEPLPLHGPLQDTFPQGPSSLQTGAMTTPQPTCLQHNNVMLPTNVQPSTSIAPPTPHFGQPASTVSSIQPASSQTRSYDELPPPNQPVNRKSESLAGLPPSQATMQTTRRPCSMTQTRIAHTHVHRLTGTMPMRSTLPMRPMLHPSSGHFQQTRDRSSSQPSVTQSQITTSMTHANEPLSSSRDLQGREQRSNREAEIEQQMRELQRELMEMRCEPSGSTPSSLRSSDFLGFDQSNPPAGDNFTSTRSDPEQQTDGATFQVQAVVHTAPTSAPLSPTAATANSEKHIHPIHQQRYGAEACAQQANEVYTTHGPTDTGVHHARSYMQPAPQYVSNLLHPSYVAGQPIQPHYAIDPIHMQLQHQAAYGQGVEMPPSGPPAVQLHMQYPTASNTGGMIPQPYVNSTGPIPTMAADGVPRMISAAHPPYVPYVLASDAQHASRQFMRTPQPAAIHVGGSTMLFGGPAQQYFAGVGAQAAVAQQGPAFAPYVHPAHASNVQRAYSVPPCNAAAPFSETGVYNRDAAGYDENAAFLVENAVGDNQNDADYVENVAPPNRGAADYNIHPAGQGAAPPFQQEPDPVSGQRGPGYQPMTAEPAAPATRNAEAYRAARRAAHDRRGQELPQFSGLPEDWPQFFCAFETTTEEYGYSDLENMGRLQRALTGEAKRRIRGILIKPQHVGKSMQILAKAFGRPDILAESQLREIRQIPKIAANRLNDMISYSMSVDSLVSLLDAPETEHLLNNYLLLKELTAKLPTADQRTWAAAARRIGPNPSIRDFAEWLSDAADDIANIRTEVIYEETTARNKETKAAQSRGRHVLLNLPAGSLEGNARCNFCGEDHLIHNCVAFRQLPVGGRLAEVRKRPLCYYCLSNDHLLPACVLKKACGVDGCERRHHELLHRPLDTPDPQSSRSSQSGRSERRQQPQQLFQTARRHPVNEADKTTATSAAQDHTSSETKPGTCHLHLPLSRPKQTLYYRVAPVVLYGPKKQINTYALFDEGSSVSLMDADLADQLQLAGETQTLNLQFVNGASSKQASRNVCVGISGIGPGSSRYDIDTVQTAKEVSLPAQTVDRRDVVELNPHLAEIPFATFDNAKPQILLGLEHHFLGVPLETKVGDGARSVAAARTKLGWVLYGCCERPTLPGAIVCGHARHISEEDDDENVRLQQLHDLVQLHFTTEEFGVKVPIQPVQSDADRRAREILEETTKRVGARFETGLLWKHDNVVLPDSYAMALRRLSSVEAKMRRNPAYAEQYRAQIQSYLDKGYARRMSDTEASTRSQRTWYLPHFAVQSASKPGKFRLVFDAAATSHDVSLNDMLLSGPDLNVPLTRLLFRFRLGAVGVCADVREMFHQVAVRSSDQDSQRFLWRDGDGAVEPSTYVMTVMTFGSTCSPTSAQFVKNRNALEFADRYPEAAEAIQRSHYVDDYVASFQTTEAAQRITTDVIEVHKRGGFDLRGVESNCPAVRARFGTVADANRTVSLEPEDMTQKVLGMIWRTDEDTFSFKTSFHKVHPEVISGRRTPTKREILSVAMSIYDPFGLLANFLLPTKVILQDLWRLGVPWDEPVPEQINQRWQEWRVQVENTRLVRIRRCHSPTIISTPGLQLHVFADASEEAFAAVAYWRVEGNDGVDLSFVAGKVRCSPLKVLTIPRLELQAAVLATRLMMEVRTSHEDLIISRIVFWTDSETVLKWLRCDQRRYVQFVAFRVSEVVENAPAEMWRYVPTALNVADDATRVRTPIAFDPDSRWLHGPQWLRDDEAMWPAQPSFTVHATEEELRPKFVGAVALRVAVEVSRYSELSRLVRVLAFVRRFVSNTRAKPEQRILVKWPTAAETERATEVLCRAVQQEAFPDEVAALSAGKLVSNKSSLFTLKPYMDDAGVLRVHGRTDAADESFMSTAAKRPIIMPRRHHVTMLIVRQHHVQMAHQLTDAVIASVRTIYWVPQLRTLVKHVRHVCQACRLRSAKPTPPPQGQLPADRLNAYARPFTHTGLDFFGPYFVTIGRRREKRWAALFTCMAVRAIHLEVAADLSTDAFLVCFRNFCHLRGVPAMIRCDNGTNFVGAKNELDRQSDFFDSDLIQRELAAKGVEWRFNCPGNPEAGGAWERLVQSVKRVLAVTLREEAPRVETFRALLLEAANVVNSRPLTHLQVDPEDPEPITPNHFLLGGPNLATAPNPADVEPMATRRQWQICRGLSRRFWKQFIRDYLPELTRRSKHYSVQQQIATGDVVIICDDQPKDGRWERGIVEDAVKGSDGEVRTATVRTARGVYRRPVTKLARLDVSPPDGIDVRGPVSAIAST